MNDGPDLLFVGLTKCESTNTPCIALVRVNMLVLIMPKTTEAHEWIKTHASLALLPIVRMPRKIM